MCVIAGNEFVSAGLVQAIAQNVLAHRLILRRDQNQRAVNVAEVVAEILAQIPLPA